MSYYIAEVINGSLRLRNNHDTSGTVLTSMPDGTEVVCSDYNSTWTHTSYGMYEGYAMKQFLNKIEDAEYWQWEFGLKNLYNGCSKSIFVKRAQKMLVHYNCLADPDGTACDGVFGDKTEAAVRTFQKNCNLSVDGIIGPATKKALDNSSNW